MSHNPNSYDLSPVIAEAYDLHETHTTDVKMIRRLIGPRRGLRVLEPFCGTGRILIPLAQDGQTLVGLDCAGGMLVRAQGKIAQLPEDVRRRVTLVQADATAGNWPTGFDLVILGGNCFYELASADEQERCVAAAAAALKPGGYAFVDNDHMEDVLPESWTRPGKRKTGWPSGVLPDGTRLEGYTENLECDVTARIWRARRTVVIHFPEGRTETHERLQQKHPVSFAEVAGWLTKHGFAIEQTFGGHDGRPYTPDAPRATFWARRGCDA